MISSRYRPVLGSLVPSLKRFFHQSTKSSFSKKRGEAERKQTEKRATVLKQRTNPLLKPDRLAWDFKNPSKTDNLNNFFEEWTEKPSMFWKEPNNSPRVDPRLYSHDNPNIVDDRIQINNNQVFINDTYIPEKFHHFVLDPMGIKKPRDLKLIKKAQKLGKKNRMRELSTDKPKKRLGPSVRQLRISVSVLNALNDTLSNGTSSLFVPGKPPPEYIMNANLHFTRCEMVNDIASAKVWWDCTEGLEKAVEKELSYIKKPLRRNLARRIQLKRVPDLQFIRESVSARAQELEPIFNKAREESYFDNILQQTRLKDLEESKQKKKKETVDVPLSVNDYFRF